MSSAGNQIWSMEWRRACACILLCQREAKSPPNIWNLRIGKLSQPPHAPNLPNFRPSAQIRHMHLVLARFLPLPWSWSLQKDYIFSSPSWSLQHDLLLRFLDAPIQACTRLQAPTFSPKHPCTSVCHSTVAGLSWNQQNKPSCLRPNELTAQKHINFLLTTKMVQNSKKI